MDIIERIDRAGQDSSIPQAWQEFNNAGNLKNPKLDERVRQVGRQVAPLCIFARLLRGERIPAKVGEGTQKSRRRGPLSISKHEK
jgi:hypothetical protein